MIDIVKAQSTGGGSWGTDARSDIWLNNGTGWSNNTIWNYPECHQSNKALCFVGSTGGDYGTRLIDVNGDGLVDIVKGLTYQSAPPLGSSDIWLNNGTGWNNNTWYYPECSGNNVSLCIALVDNSGHGTRFGDINGDGLIDIIKAKELVVSNGPGVSDIWLNNGTGWNNQTGWQYVPCVR